MEKASVLITGASSGIGATYADRFARRGHDLVLVARNEARLQELAAKLRAETGVAVDIMVADLSEAEQIATVEVRLRDDARIGILVNNAGAGLGGQFIEQSIDDADRLSVLHTTSVMRLTHAIAPRLVAKGEGAIINIGSVVGFAPEFGSSVYGATKAFVLFFSQGLALELIPKGVHVQAVLPAGTRTELWARAGADEAKLPPLMDVGEMVDAALAGFDRRETVTIPPLHDIGLWEAYDAARLAMMPGFHEDRPAARYVA
jgi:short-subunit dehydrogenase